MLRAIVLLEGESSAQSEVLNALDWVFMKAISIVWCIELFFTLTSPSVPATEKQPPPPPALGCDQLTLLLGWYSAGDEQSLFPSNMMLRIEIHQTR